MELQLVTTKRFLLLLLVLGAVEPWATLVGAAAISGDRFESAASLLISHYTASAVGMMVGNAVVVGLLATMRPARPSQRWERVVFLTECVVGSALCALAHLAFFIGVAREASSTEGIAIVLYPVYTGAILLVYHVLAKQAVVFFDQ